MSASVHDILYKDYVTAYAAEVSARAAFVKSVGDLYQDPDAALRNIARRIREDGPLSTLRVLTHDPARCGALRGHWLTSDRYTSGGKARAEEAGQAQEKLPGLGRQLGEAEEGHRAACAAYEAYCLSHDIEPSRPWQDDRQSIGAARVPAHLVEPEPTLVREWWWGSGEGPYTPDPSWEDELEREPERDR